MASRFGVFIGLWVCVLAVAGCGGSGGQSEADASTQPQEQRLTLEELLRQPRAELAKKADEVLLEIRTRDAGQQKGKLTYTLLPKWYQPIGAPAFQDVRFVPELGVSLPPYVDPKEVGQQPEIAAQFRLFGDEEAAVKLEGKPAREPSEAGESKNYPLEWSRLIVMRLHALQQRLALGEADALTEIIDLRKQLESLLDEKTRQGPLGMVLLHRGRRTLEMAGEACRQLDDTAGVSTIEGALATYSSLQPMLPVSGTKEHWAKLLRTQPQGHVLACTTPARAIDLLQLPLPVESADVALFFFDDKDQMKHVVIAYNARVQPSFPHARDLAGGFTDWVAPEDGTTIIACKQALGDLRIETRVSPLDATVGAWVCITPAGPSAPVVVPRRLGAANLDWTFDHNRLVISPLHLGNPLLLKEDNPLLQRIPNPLPAGLLQDAAFIGAAKDDVLQQVLYRYRPGTPWYQVALPLFAELGMGQWVNQSRDEGHLGRLRIAWEDPDTTLSFQVPHESRDFLRLDLHDRTYSSGQAERVEAVRKREAAERRQRIESGEPATRLPRKVEYVGLGMDRTQLAQYLPKGQAIIKRDFDDGILVAINTPVPRDAGLFMIREVMARFDARNRVTWARVRYESAARPRNPKEGDWARQVLESWRRNCGATPQAPSVYAARSSDLPLQKPAGVSYRWQDDLTDVTFLADATGVEVTVADRPLEDRDRLPPLSFLSRGPTDVVPGLVLGATRSTVETALPAKPTQAPDGAWAFGLARGPFDVIMVWFKDDQVSQISARYREGENPRTGDKDMEKRLNELWGTEIRTVGWPMRRDLSPQGALQSLTWYDDSTRYRLYWADTDNSPPRLWSEWQK